MSKITAIILAVLSVLLISVGVVRQVNYSEKYVQTKAELFYEKERVRLPSEYMYSYRVGFDTYIAEKSGGFGLSERNIVYDKASPSKYHFGYVDIVAKVLFFVGILFAMAAAYVFVKFVLYEDYLNKLYLIMAVYSAVGLLVITESLMIAILAPFFTVMVIEICVSARYSGGYY